MNLAGIDTAVPEGDTEKLERIAAERAYLIELVTELRREIANLKAELAGVPVDELPF